MHRHPRRTANIRVTPTVENTTVPPIIGLLPSTESDVVMAMSRSTIDSHHADPRVPEFVRDGPTRLGVDPPLRPGR